MDATKTPPSIARRNIAVDLPLPANDALTDAVSLDAPTPTESTSGTNGTAVAVTAPRNAGARPLIEITQGILMVFVTAAFVTFCIASVFAAWFLIGEFANESYKAVAAFLVFIVVANVTSKYLAWCIGKLS